MERRLAWSALPAVRQRGADEGLDLPTVGQLMTDLLEVAVSHVVDAEDEAVLVLGNGIANILEEPVLILTGLLVDLGHVERLGAF